MNMCPYIIFRDQQCQEAFEFYQRVLGGEIVAMLKARGSPMEQHCPPDQLDNIMHARLKIGEQLLMGADASAERYQPMQGFTVTLEPKTTAESERIYRELSKDGKIEMELQPTFWSTRFGIFRDRYGTPWMISCEEQPARQAV